MLFSSSEINLGKIHSKEVSKSHTEVKPVSRSVIGSVTPARRVVSSCSHQAVHDLVTVCLSVSYTSDMSVVGYQESAL